VQIVDKITLGELNIMSEKMSEPLVKGVVDVVLNLLVVDADMHSDQELFLLESESKQEDLWGINLWPDNYGTDDFIEFDSMINLRPWQNNRSRGVEDEKTRKKIAEIVAGKVYE